MPHINIGTYTVYIALPRQHFFRAPPRQDGCLQLRAIFGNAMRYEVFFRLPHYSRENSVPVKFFIHEEHATKLYRSEWKIREIAFLMQSRS